MDFERLLAGAADGHLVELDGGHAYAYGDGLAGFAAGSYAFVEGEVVADHGDVLEGFGAVADEGGAFDGAGDLAVFDEVGLGGGEDELAVGDVDLASAEVDGVEAALDGLDDVLGHVVAVEHVGVGHARHGDVVVALAAAGAGVGGSHEAGGELVGEVALEDAVLDEDVFLGGVALVVDVDGAAAVGHAAVVDDGDLGADATCWPMRPAKAEVFLRLKSASRPWPTASWSRTPGQPGPRTTSISPAGAAMAPSWRMAVRAASRAKCSGDFVAFEEVHGDAAAAAAGAAGGAASAIVACGVLGDDEDVEAGEGLGVGGEGAVGGGDEDAAQLVGEAGADLGDAGVVGAGSGVGALDEGELGGDLGVGGGAGDGVEASRPRCGGSPA